MAGTDQKGALGVEGKVLKAAGFGGSKGELVNLLAKPDAPPRGDPLRRVEGVTGRQHPWSFDPPHKEIQLVKWRGVIERHRLRKQAFARIAVPQHFRRQAHGQYEQHRRNRSIAVHRTSLLLTRVPAAPRRSRYHSPRIIWHSDP